MGKGARLLRPGRPVPPHGLAHGPPHGLPHGLPRTLPHGLPYEVEAFRGGRLEGRRVIGMDLFMISR